MEQIEIAVSMVVEQFSMVNQLEGTSIEDIPIVNEYHNVFLDELLGMPPE